jgi:hypothetical protein
MITADWSKKYKLWTTTQTVILSWHIAHTLSSVMGFCFTLGFNSTFLGTGVFKSEEDVFEWGRREPLKSWVNSASINPNIQNN